MDANENTKSEQDVMQKESPRKCKICGGPNHQGCGCEARQKKAAVQVETESIGADKSSAIVEAVKVDEKLKSLAIDFAGAKIAAEAIRGEAEQITILLSDILELLKTIHNDLAIHKVQNGKVNKD